MNTMISTLNHWIILDSYPKDNICVWIEGDSQKWEWSSVTTPLGVNYQKHGVPCEWRFGDKSNPTAIHHKLVSAHLIPTAVYIQLAEHYSTFITLFVALLLSCCCFKSDLISESSTELSVRVCTVSWWVGSCLFFFVGADNFAVHTEFWFESEL